VAPDTINHSFDPDGAIDAGLANSLFDSFATTICATALVQPYTLMSVHILGQQDAANKTAYDSTRTPVAGSRTATIGQLGAPLTCALVRKRTAFAGKAQRGRLYFPGLTESDVDAEGVILGATRSTLQTAFNTWFANIGTYGNMMLAHSCFHEDNQPPCEPLPWTVVTSLEVDDVIATQRRRLHRG
jgi:hypothetical protein